MASTVHISCLRALRNQSHRIGRESSTLKTANRAFMTTSRHNAAFTKVDAAPTTPIPSVTSQTAEGASKPSPSPVNKLASELRRVTGKTTETYTAYGVMEALYSECAKQADYSIPQASDPEAEMPKTADGEDLGVGTGWWHTDLGLKPTFSTWSQITMLHMYLLFVRIRCFSVHDSRPWQQHLLDHFFYDAENRMVLNHNMHARGTRNKYLKDLFIQWRGILAVYDEGLVKGDAMLAAAIWRNVFKASEEVDVKSLAAIVSYMRRVLRDLDAVDDEVVRTGSIAFGDPREDMKVVMTRSSLMDLPFKDGEVVNEPVTSSAR